MLFELVGKYFWLICLLFCGPNYLTAMRNMGSTLDAEGRRLMKLFALGGALPWLVMGWGQLFGGVPSVFHFFRPQDKDPFVLAWVGTVFILTVWFAAFVFFANGARKVREYGLMAALGRKSRKPPSIGIIKVQAFIGPFFSIFWICLTTGMNIPLPK